MTKQKNYLNKTARWALFILLMIMLLALCARMGEMSEGSDHFRGVDRIFE